MRAPSAPPQVPEPPWPANTPARGDLAQGQAAMARATRALTLLLGAVRDGNTRGAGSRIAHGYLPTPQPFIPRTSLELDPAIGGELAHLPGVLPPTAWDGEPGSTNPLSAFL